MLQSGLAVHLLVEKIHKESDLVTVMSLSSHKPSFIQTCNNSFETFDISGDTSAATVCVAGDTCFDPLSMGKKFC